MAQTKKRKKSKHRGTQGGQISHSRPRGKPQNRAEAAAQAEARRKRRKRTAATQPRGPTWSGAVKKGLFAGVLFFVMMTLLFGRTVGSAIVLAALMLIIYIPLSFQLDKIFHRRRLRTEELERIEKAALRKAQGTTRRKARSEPEPSAKRSWFRRRGGDDEPADDEPAPDEPAADEPAERKRRGKRAKAKPTDEPVEDEPVEDEPLERKPRGKRAKAKPVAKPADEPAEDQVEEELTWEDAAAPPPKRSLFRGRS